MNNLILLNFNECQIRIHVNEASEIWFVSKDICDVLMIKNSRQAVRKLTNGYKKFQVISTTGGPQVMTIINESGLYKLLIQSRKPQAKSFKQWLSQELLPHLNNDQGTPKFHLD